MVNRENNIYYEACYNEEIANLCVYGADFVKEILGIQNNYNYIYHPHNEYLMSQKRIEGFMKISECRKYYQENPVIFIRDFFNIVLLDSQAYLLQQAWDKPYVIILASRAYGKSFWIVLFAMAKQMLASSPWNCYFASGSSQQSATTFKKLEDVSNNRIESLLNSTGELFKNEVVIPNSAGDGFSHAPSGFSYTLHNGSYTQTLNSNVDKNRGKRASCVIFDECGFLSADLIQVYRAFCLNEKDFKTGFDKDGKPIDIVKLVALPTEIPNQLIYVSSASNTDTEFYKIYRDYSKRMLMGDKDYFVAHIDCDLVMRPTIHGAATKPLLKQSTIDAAMRSNPEKARREYYCEFTSDAGASAIIKRGMIRRNEENRVPELYNPNGSKQYIITYDPARSHDNSVILVSEVYEGVLEDGTKDTMMRFVNCINLLDVGKKIKSPMQTPDQVKYLKQIILDYNGGADAYQNILGIYIDAGSGGAGKNIADYLMEDWTDDKGILHRGFIDKEYHADYIKKFPNAVDKLRMIEPAKYKSEMFEAMIELMSQDKIKFTADYDNKGYLTIFDVDEEKYQQEKKRLTTKLKKENIPQEEFNAVLENSLSHSNVLKPKVVKLDWMEELALTNIDAMKEELVNMIRKPRESGKDSFELCPEKANRLHDDRAYTAALASYGLMKERRKKITERKRQASFDITKMVSMSKKPKSWRKH